MQPWLARHHPLAGSPARQPARRLAGTTARQPTAARLQPIGTRHRCANSSIASLHTVRLDRLLHDFAVGMLESLNTSFIRILLSIHLIQWATRSLARLLFRPHVDTVAAR